MNSNNFHILLIEDNPGDVVLFKEATEQSDFNVYIQTLHDGESAIEYFKDETTEEKKNIDIICLDLNLPKVDGFEVLEFIKSQNALKHIPVIILSGSESDGDISKSYLKHANSYIVKPDELKKYTEMVTGLFNYWFATVTLVNNE
jgi:CheY-like chemotaxis protein